MISLRFQIILRLSCFALQWVCDWSLLTSCRRLCWY